MSEYNELRERLREVRDESRKLASLPSETVDRILKEVAHELTAKSDTLLSANARDLARMDPQDPKYDRLLLNEQRLKQITADILKVAAFASPLRTIHEQRMLDSGIELLKVSTPLGVVGIVFESRPNVMFDVFALSFKAGNACVLKGGSDAHESNLAIEGIIKTVLKRYDLSTVLYLLPADRGALTEMLKASEFIDVIIPRGSQGLIEHVRQNAVVPVIETGAGIVHTYVDASANLDKAAAIIHNAKTRRVSVCNALDTMVLHQDHLQNLQVLTEQLNQAGVEIYADKRSHDALKKFYSPDQLFHADTKHFGKEFLSLRMSIKTVNDLSEAIDHIHAHTSKHSEAIVAEDQETVNTFFEKVDAAVVYANASTAYTDGGEFGLGAEIGISTQKLHARGPMGLEALTSYKWLAVGDGQIRSKG